MKYTAQKVYVFGVTLVRIFPTFSRIRAECKEILFSPNAGNSSRYKSSNLQDINLVIWMISKMKLKNRKIFHGILNEVKIFSALT